MDTLKNDTLKFNSGFIFEDWLKEHGFKMAKMYNPKRFDYDFYIGQDRVVVGFDMEKRVVDFGSTKKDYANSFGLSIPFSKEEAELVFKLHCIELRPETREKITWVDKAYDRFGNEVEMSVDAANKLVYGDPKGKLKQ